MDLVNPGIGLIFWTTLVFILLLIILRKYAWKPILKAVRKRNEEIEGALGSVKKAREELGKLREDNERITKEARQERKKVIQETNEVKKKIITEAKQTATREQEKIYKESKQNIKNELAGVEAKLKNIISELSIEIAEKLLRKELSEKKEKEELVKELLKDIKLN